MIPWRIETFGGKL